MVAAVTAILRYDHAGGLRDMFTGTPFPPPPLLFSLISLWVTLEFYILKRLA